MSNNPRNRRPPLGHAEGLGGIGSKGHPEAGSRPSEVPVKAGGKAVKYINK